VIFNVVRELTDRELACRESPGCRSRYTGWPKKLAHFFVRLNFIRLNFIKYWPIFKLIGLSESGEHFSYYCH